MQESVNMKREGGRSRRQRQTKRQRVEDVGLICLFVETLHQVESSGKQPIRVLTVEQGGRTLRCSNAEQRLQSPKDWRTVEKRNQNIGS